MYFTQALLSLAASAAVVTAAANTVIFWSLDTTARTIYFTPNAGQASLDPVALNGNGIESVDFPEGWIGNFHTVKEGEANTDGMLGEVAFNGWDGLTYYDVSAIVNPNDTDNVKQLVPISDISAPSGCHTFPCNNAYYAADDLQTKTTTETMLLCTIGTGMTGLESLDS